jgi:hypothetical protein
MTADVPAAVRRCVGCNRTVGTPYCPYCGLNAAGLGSDPVIGPDVAALLRRFNVGAGLGAGFWTFGNGAPVLGSIYWISLPLLPPIALGIMTYLFINGNRVALQRRRFASIERFRRVQRVWAFVGVVGGVLAVLAGIFAFMMLLAASAGS